MNKIPFITIIMTLRFKIWFCTIFFILSLLSCSKRKDDPQPSPQPNFGIFLDHVFEIDTTKTAPNDTLGRFYFKYDNANRLIYDSFYSNTQYSNNTFFETREIHYNGSDTMASWSTKKSWLASGFLFGDTIWYSFSAGKYSKDSANFVYAPPTPTGTARTYFTYKAGVILKDFQNWIPQYNYSTIERDTIHQTFENGTLVYQIDTLFSYANGQSPTTQIFETNVSYLSNPNPYFKIFNCISRPFFNDLGIGNFSTNQYIPEHLISQQISKSGSVTYAYQFRIDGYPISSIVTLTRNGNKKITKLLFFYKE